VRVREDASARASESPASPPLTLPDSPRRRCARRERSVLTRVADSEREQPHGHEERTHGPHAVEAETEWLDRKKACDTECVCVCVKGEIQRQKHRQTERGRQVGKERKREKERTRETERERKERQGRGGVSSRMAMRSEPCTWPIRR
jgi:hypothetical protein